MPTRTAEDRVVEAVKERFPETVLEAKVQREKRVLIAVQKDRLAEVASFVKEKLGFDHITSVAGVDYPDRKEFDVIYDVWSIPKKILLELKTAIPVGDPKLQSLISVWPGSNYHERETWEMFGIEFQGHPNLSRFLLPEDWDKGAPFRKDFKLPKAPR